MGFDFAWLLRTSRYLIDSLSDLIAWLNTPLNFTMPVIEYGTDTTFVFTGEYVVLGTPLDIIFGVGLTFILFKKIAGLFIRL